MAQSGRRYMDTRDAFPHLANGAKYLLGSVSMVFAVMRSIHGDQFMYPWISFAIFSSICSFIWDIVMDWGFVRISKTISFRTQFSYPHKSIYYLAAISNAFCRLSWLAPLLMEDVNPFILSTALVLLEIIRRFQWNMYRVENEHQNNCMNYRAVKYSDTFDKFVMGDAIGHTHASIEEKTSIPTTQIESPLPIPHPYHMIKHINSSSFANFPKEWQSERSQTATTYQDGVPAETPKSAETPVDDNEIHFFPRRSGTSENLQELRSRASSFARSTPHLSPVQALYTISDQSTVDEQPLLIRRLASMPAQAFPKRDIELAPLSSHRRSIKNSSQTNSNQGSILQDIPDS
eukprot:TRINITY_DN2133_c0_g1_i10.p1 TRINITY_DN2133_c0_g1~~TRINITY_DN2133_c0_g1_i10.p1  ORF type:complete len:347 (-),score=47.10 TRINITY_DN2133_c0_g1_i10:106-1146(-)